MKVDGNLEAFWEGLRPFLFKNTCRPFVCDGSPFDCQVMVVGFNPATVIDEHFSAFWSNENGFLRAKFDQAYCKARGSETSATRGKLVNLRQCWPLTMETNLFSVPSGSQDDLAKEDRVTTTLFYLLDAVKPKLVFAYSSGAVRVMRLMCKGAYQPSRLIDASFLDHPFQLYCLPNFYRHGDAIKIGKELSNLFRT